MKAAVVTRYGPPEVVEIRDVPTPVPGAGDVLVKVVAAAVTAGDARIRGAAFPPGFGLPARLAIGLRRPRRPVLGIAFSGVIEDAGPDTGFVPGDEVCGMSPRMGAHAEYLVVPAAKVARKPATVSPEDAAGVLFGGTTALFFLRDKAQLRPGSSVLVNGASGAVGTNAVQLAKRAGATVTAVTSGRNADFVRRLGADRVIDYTATPLARLTDRFDVVFDTVGNLSPADAPRLLNPDGALLLAVASLRQTIAARGPVKAGSAPERLEDVAELVDLVANDELAVVLDEVFAFADIVDAYRRVDSRRKVGNVLVRI